VKWEAVTQEEFEYRGRRVSVEVVLADGKYGWVFRIADEKPVRLSRSPASTTGQAFEEAISAAKSVLDLREAVA